MKAGYARESTTKTEQEQAFAWQVERLKRYGCDRIFSDRMSGASTKRPGYNEMMDLAKAGMITEIVVCSLTRLGRSTRQIYDAVDLCLARGIKLIALDNSIDLNTPSGRANVHLQAVFAQLERELIQERINAGYEGIRSNRYAIRAPFGYKLVDRQLHIDPDLLELCRWMRKSVVEKGLIKTTQALNERYPKPQMPKMPRTPGGLKAWLQCSTLYGHLTYGRHKEEQLVYRNNHPALFTEQERLEVEEAMNFRRRAHGFKSDPIRFPLSGLVVCAACGANMQVSYKANRDNPVIYYRCTYWLRRTCTNNKYIPVPKIQKAVIQALVDRAEAIANKEARQLMQVKDTPEELALKEQLAALQKMPTNPHIESAINAIKNDLAEMMQSQQAEKRANLDLEESLVVYSNPFFWENLEPEKVPKFYRMLVRRIFCLQEVQSVELWI